MKSNENKKRLVFFDCVIHFGGSNQSTLLTIREVQKSCDIIVLDAYGVCKEYHQALERFNIKNIVLLPNPRYPYIGGENLFLRTGRVLASGIEMVKLVVRLKQAIKNICPDAVWTNSNKGLFFLSRASGREIPRVYYVRGQSVYPKWYGRRDWMGLSLVVANSRSGLSKLRNSPFGALKMEVVYNGIDFAETTKLASEDAPNIPSGGGMRLIFPASLNQNKNQGTAVRGLAEYIQDGGDACLWFCGDYKEGVFDDYAKSLPVLAGDLNISDRVHFLGWRNDIPAVMDRSDIVVLTSLSEGMPRVLLEAMCLKKPVIATRVGGIPEVIRDGIDGILIEPGDSKGFAKAVAKLACPALREKMGQAGFERVKSCFDIKVTADRFLEAIDKIC